MNYPNLRHLEIFRALVQTLSVTRTAKLLNVSQPAVSKAMAQLQRTVGLELFTRVRGRLQPSGDGLRLLAEAERLLNQVSHFSDEVHALHEARHGRLAVAAIPSLAIGSLARSVGLFSQGYPKVQIEFYTEMSARIVEDVEKHRIEIGFIHGDPQSRNIRARVVGESEFVCQFRADHPLAAKRSVRAGDLRGEPLVLLSPASPPNHLIRESFAAAGVHPNVVTEINASHLAGDIVGNAGVAFVDPVSANITTSPATVCRAFRPRIPLRICCISSAHRPLSRVADIFQTVAEQEIRRAIQDSRVLFGGA